MRKSYQLHTCANCRKKKCGKGTKGSGTCSHCDTGKYYCSINCQKKHWKIHKSVCFKQECMICSETYTHKEHHPRLMKCCNNHICKECYERLDRDDTCCRCPFCKKQQEFVQYRNQQRIMEKAVKDCIHARAIWLTRECSVNDNSENSLEYIQNTIQNAQHSLSTVTQDSNARPSERVTALILGIKIEWLSLLLCTSENATFTAEYDNYTSYKAAYALSRQVTIELMGGTPPKDDRYYDLIFESLAKYAKQSDWFTHVNQDTYKSTVNDAKSIAQQMISTISFD